MRAVTKVKIPNHIKIAIVMKAKIIIAIRVGYRRALVFEKEKSFTFIRATYYVTTAVAILGIVDNRLALILHCFRKH